MRALKTLLIDTSLVSFFLYVLPSEFNLSNIQLSQGLNTFTGSESYLWTQKNYSCSHYCTSLNKKIFLQFRIYLDNRFKSHFRSLNFPCQFLQLFRQTLSKTQLKIFFPAVVTNPIQINKYLASWANMKNSQYDRPPKYVVRLSMPAGTK